MRSLGNVLGKDEKQNLKFGTIERALGGRELG
jgi:hypothetical protein